LGIPAGIPAMISIFALAIVFGFFFSPSGRGGEWAEPGVGGAATTRCWTLTSFSKILKIEIYQSAYLLF